MIEVRGDLWKLPAASDSSHPPSGCLRLITTNGACRQDGAAIMGRGCALQAKEVVPGVEYKLGGLLAEHGNRVMRLAALPDGSHLGTFPVKHHWREDADLGLIERSAHQLVDLADGFGYQRLLLPRPGCGNGQVSYDAVRPILEEILTGDCFEIVTY